MIFENRTIQSGVASIQDGFSRQRCCFWSSRSWNLKKIQCKKSLSMRFRLA